MNAAYKRTVVAGGGAAGWMTATALAALRLQVTLPAEMPALAYASALKIT